MEILIALLILLTCFFFVAQPFFAPPPSRAAGERCGVAEPLAADVEAGRPLREDLQAPSRGSLASARSASRALPPDLAKRKAAIRQREHVCPDCLRFFPRSGSGDQAPFVRRCGDCAAKEREGGKAKTLFRRSDRGGAEKRPDPCGSGRG